MFFARYAPVAQTCQTHSVKLESILFLILLKYIFLFMKILDCIY